MMINNEPLLVSMVIASSLLNSVVYISWLKGPCLSQEILDVFSCGYSSLAWLTNTLWVASCSPFSACRRVLCSAWGAHDSAIHQRRQADIKNLFRHGLWDTSVQHQAFQLGCSIQKPHENYHSIRVKDINPTHFMAAALLVPSTIDISDSNGMVNSHVAFVVRDSNLVDSMLDKCVSRALHDVCLSGWLFIF